jgi:hypothetical protein
MSMTYSYYKNMQINNIIFVYQGEVTADLVSSILQMIENKLEGEGEDKKVKKRVFNVMVECLQNVYHHLDALPPTDPNNPVKDKTALLMIGREEKDYFIITGNHVLNDRIPEVKARLDRINRATKEELKQLYQEILTGGEFSEKGTAGLGMIDIARKSGQKLGYDFHPVNDKYSFFSLEARVSRIPDKG